MLNDHSMYEHILEDDIFFGVIGMLECRLISYTSTLLVAYPYIVDDPEFPAHKANYREFLHQTSRFHQPIPIHDDPILRKIHHTYRLQFMKDVVLARALDDSTFNVLNSCIIFNQIDIINYVQQDPMFLRDVVRLYVDEDMLQGGGKRQPGPEQETETGTFRANAEGQVPNGVNGQVPTRAGSYAFSPPEELSQEDITSSLPPPLSPPSLPRLNH